MVHAGHRASNAHRSLVDLFEFLGEAIFCQRAPIGLKGVGQQALRPGKNIGSMNGPDLFRMRQVPQLITFAFANARALQFGAHGAVHEQDFTRV